jgi:hypothetical protein
LKVGNCLVNVEIDGRTVFLEILEKYDRRLNTWFIRPRIGQVAEYRTDENESLVCIGRGIHAVAEKLSAFEERFYSMS